MQYKTYTGRNCKTNCCLLNWSNIAVLVSCNLCGHGRSLSKWMLGSGIMQLLSSITTIHSFSSYSNDWNIIVTLLTGDVNKPRSYREQDESYTWSRKAIRIKCVWTIVPSKQHLRRYIKFVRTLYSCTFRPHYPYQQNFKTQNTYIYY